MAYGMIDDTYLKQVADTVRYRAGLSSDKTVSLCSVYKPDEYGYPTDVSKGNVKAEDYICYIPGGINTTFLCTVELGVVGLLSSYQGKKITVSYTQHDGSHCVRKTSTYNAVDLNASLKSIYNVVPGTYLDIKSDDTFNKNSCTTNGFAVSKYNKQIRVTPKAEYTYVYIAFAG